MEIRAEKQTDNQTGSQSLETADAVARAAHIWIRSLCLSEMQEADERHSMACGLIAGLCGRLELDPRVQELVAYVYALLDDEGARSLAASRVMLQQSIRPANLPAYSKGISEAAAIVEMLAYHKRRN
jgi:hypothetical protein